MQTAVLCSIMPNPTPTTPTNFRIAQELQFQHADCTSKVHKKCPAVLYASSFFSHPHWPYIAACCLHSTPSSSNVTAGGSQYVICAKYEIHKTFNQQLQPRGYSIGTTHAICGTLSSFPAQYLPLALTRSPKGLAMHKLLYIPNFSGVELRRRYSVYD